MEKVWLCLLEVDGSVEYPIFKTKISAEKFAWDFVKECMGAIVDSSLDIVKRHGVGKCSTALSNLSTLWGVDATTLTEEEIIERVEREECYEQGIKAWIEYQSEGGSDWLSVVEVEVQP